MAKDASLSSTAKKMTIVHKCMFFASIIMWAMSTAHLGLLIQRLSYGKSTLWEAKAAVSLATLQLLAVLYQKGGTNLECIRKKQGILPTLILLTVHFELAPGSRVSSSEFMLSTDHEFQTAEAPAITFKEGTSIGYSGSKTTVSTLKDGTSDEPLEKRYEV
ncbi:hypothetical protein JR316_0005665 [Psilocybe cubensis]|uniref:Uncharacterized protein n=1 Tax=Psilocybe cubensis TaxID=181762 RepID=A0ACB8H1S8_PSICU|nr:hypothetical protein JR316_0005665 [Psilocybe cubensis]KAH9481145.1 hypothetical protein JR316_0005665 [Psilocybe cubensis]